ncbi:MAG: helix-turn-helix domain-containing protein [bacterium]
MDIVNEIVYTLKAAREAKGFSQRELAALADIPQSHISKIEKGSVDLRVSSLVELARALDLELALIPRKSMPAVKSIVRNITSAGRSKNRENASDIHAAEIANKSLTQLQQALIQALVEKPELKEIAQILRYVRELQQLNPMLEDKTLDQLKSMIKAFEPTRAQVEDFRQILDFISSLRSTASVSIPGPESPQPAYSFEGKDDE